jgi:hypothetical protein
VNTGFVHVFVAASLGASLVLASFGDASVEIGASLPPSEFVPASLEFDPPLQAVTSTSAMSFLMRRDYLTLATPSHKGHDQPLALHVH